MICDVSCDMIGIGHAEQFGICILTLQEMTRWSNLTSILYQDGLSRHEVCQKYIPRPSKGVKFQPLGLFLVVKGLKFQTLGGFWHKFYSDLHCIPSFSIGKGSSNTNGLSIFYNNSPWSVSRWLFHWCLNVVFPFCWPYLGKIPNCQEYD